MFIPVFFVQLYPCFLAYVIIIIIIIIIIVIIIIIYHLYLGYLQILKRERVSLTKHSLFNIEAIIINIIIEEWKGVTLKVFRKYFFFMLNQ